MLIPSIVFPNPVEPFGAVVFKPGVPWSYDDPGHQLVFKQLIERSGARVTFVQAGDSAAATNATSLDASVTDCLEQIDRARTVLSQFDTTRKAEITKLTLELNGIKAQVREEAAKVELGEATPTDPKQLPEAQLKQYLGTSEGATLADQRQWIETRIAKLTALMAAAADGSDSTMQVSQANTTIANAQRRIKDVQAAIAAVAPPASATADSAEFDPVAAVASLPIGSLQDVKGVGKSGDTIIAACRAAVAARSPSNGAVAPAGAGPTGSGATVPAVTTPPPATP